MRFSRKPVSGINPGPGNPDPSATHTPLPQRRPEKTGETPASRTRSDLTYRWDRVRGTASGIAETSWQVFALLIAIRVFEAEPSLKQNMPAALGIGLLLTPLSLTLFSRLETTLNRILGLLWIGVGVAFLGMALSPNILLFVLAVSLAQILSAQGIPVLTHIYSANYHSNERGSRLSTTFVIHSLSGVVFGFAGGKILDWNVAAWPLLFLTAAAGSVLIAFALHRFPARPAASLKVRNPIAGLKVAWEDKLFGTMLFAWMLMGIGNLMLIPLRVEYLANPLYGINASNAEVSAILVSTVLVCRLLSTKIWGFFFDRLNVITLRVTLNLIFMASIGLFFFSTHLWIMAAGAGLLGIAFGGGGILWTLYVTKIAPEDKVTTYMSVHGFLTGLRMAFAPFIGYALLVGAHPSFAAWIALVLIGVSTLLFLPLRSRIGR